MKKEFLLSIILSAAFLSLGFILLHYQLIGYGVSFFVFLPFLIGFILGKSTMKAFSLVGFIIALALFFVMLIAGQLEGMVCVLMTLPIIFAAVGLGALINYFIKRNSEKDKESNLIKSSILPLIFFLGISFFEKWIVGNDKVLLESKTEMVLPNTCMQVYDAIKNVDTLIAEKPFLMRLDLPIPNKCILEKEEVGGLRTCYFSGGTITEKITALEKGKLLKMDVIDYKLTGRKWLGFKEAIYYFDKVGEDSCKITRVTTYTSMLTPRFYWQPLEEIGIQQEHEYVFANLKRDLERLK
jgi:hypothetical protein